MARLDSQRVTPHFSPAKRPTKPPPSTSERPHGPATSWASFRSRRRIWRWGSRACTLPCGLAKPVPSGYLSYIAMERSTIFNR